MLYNLILVHVHVQLYFPPLVSDRQYFTDLPPPLCEQFSEYSKSPTFYVSKFYHFQNPPSPFQSLISFVIGPLRINSCFNQHNEHFFLKQILHILDMHFTSPLPLYCMFLFFFYKIQSQLTCYHSDQKFTFVKSYMTNKIKHNILRFQSNFCL